MVTRQAVYQQLKKVLDPEIAVNIVELGLIYKVEIKENDVKIVYTLTFPGCPLSSVIHEQIRKEISKIKGIGKIDLVVTFDPPWDLSMASEKVKAKLRVC